MPRAPPLGELPSEARLRGRGRLRGTNPLRLCFANPPPPKGGGFALLTGSCRKAPPSGELDATNGSGLRGFRRPLGGTGCERSEQTEGVPRRGLNSLSQSLTALPAPSGREPLAKPRTLHVSREVCRHAKGPIPEGAGTAIAVTGGVSLVTLPYKTAKRPLKM